MEEIICPKCGESINMKPSCYCKLSEIPNGCYNCGNYKCFTRNNCPEEVHTAPPCTGWIKK